MGNLYAIKKFGNGVHVVLPKGLFKEGQEVLVTDDLFMKDRLTDIQRKEVKIIVQEALWEAKQGY